VSSYMISALLSYFCILPMYQTLNIISMWSLYVGRPWGINIRDISISRPQRAIDPVRRKGWSPYGNAQEPSNPTTQLNLIDPVESCADANVSLCEMMRRISRTL
jgi:hypothetical protein